MARTGRPPHQPTDKDRKYVQSLCAHGLTEEDIAKIVGISPPTLRKHYRQELDTALALANAKTAERLYSFIDGKIGTPREWLTACIFRLKTKGGWQEVQRHEHGGAKDADPIRHETTHKVDVTGLTKDEREFVRAILKRRAEQPG